MTTPSRWRSPASFTPVGSSSGVGQTISYANGYWFYCTSWFNSGSGVREYRLQYATDPNGPWAEATLPANPASHTATSDITTGDRVLHDGTDYAILLGYTNGGTRKYRILHATSPGGTWTSYEFDATDLYRPTCFAYGNSLWVIAGWYNSGSPTPAFVATSGTADGTYTFDTTASSTGLSAGAATNLLAIDYDGTYWAQVGARASDVYIQTASAPTGTWTTEQSYTTPYPVEFGYQAGYWSARLDQDYIYASDPTGAWGTVVQADHGIDNADGITYDGTAWLAYGYDLVSFVGYPAASYLVTTGDPVGAFTPANVSSLGTASGQVTSSRAGGGAWVLSSYIGGTDALAYVPGAVTSTYLRLHQSPVRTPSRVRPVQLRQRQRPEVTT